jgi:hypothetical protein
MISGPVSLPLIGNLHQLGMEPYKAFMKMSEKYGGIFSIDFGSVRGVVLNDYKLIKQCFSEEAFSGRPDLQLFTDRNGGKGKGISFTPFVFPRCNTLIVKTFIHFLCLFQVLFFRIIGWSRDGLFSGISEISDSVRQRTFINSAFTFTLSIEITKSFDM